MNTGLAVLSVLALLAMPVAHAQPPPSIPPAPTGPAPGNFTASYDAANHTVRLSWTPPGNGTYNYTLYRNGAPLVVLEATAYNDTTPQAADLYTLRADNGHTQTSSYALVVGETAVCDPLLLGVETNPPHFGWGIRPECLPSGVPNVWNIVRCRFGFLVNC